MRPPFTARSETTRARSECGARSRAVTRRRPAHQGLTQPVDQAMEGVGRRPIRIHAGRFRFEARQCSPGPPLTYIDLEEEKTQRVESQKAVCRPPRSPRGRG